MDDSSDGGFLIWIGLGAAIAVGAGFFLWFRMGPASPPPPIAPVAVPITVSTPVRAPVAPADLAVAKEAGLSLSVTKREAKTAPDGVQRWIFTVVLKNDGKDPVEVRRLSETNTWLETRAAGGEVVSHETSQPSPTGDPVKLGGGESLTAEVGFKFAGGVSGEGRLVHADEAKDGTRRCVASEWFPLEEPK